MHLGQCLKVRGDGMHSESDFVSRPGAHLAENITCQVRARSARHVVLGGHVLSSTQLRLPRQRQVLNLRLNRCEDNGVSHLFQDYACDASLCNPKSAAFFAVA